MYREKGFGEEGTDYITVSKEVPDPDMPNTKLFERQVKREINQMKMEDPLKAKEFEEFMFKRNVIDEISA
jgi:hypothetical protein